ncbi:MAG: response regulator [Caldiserica bacterium]|nr:MAG: response regulator [Caldisericota bacterium]
MKKTVLLIEDNPDNREIVETVLRKNSYKVISACDGEEALKRLKKGNYDLVLLDLSLPKISGWDLIKMIREDERIKDLPVIALTAHAMQGDKEKAIEAGCNDYISKPCKPYEIVEKVKRWINEEK